MGRKVERAPSSETISLIEQQILNEQLGPEQISNWLKINNYEGVTLLCHTPINSTKFAKI